MLKDHIYTAHEQFLSDEKFNLCFDNQFYELENFTQKLSDVKLRRRKTLSSGHKKKMVNTTVLKVPIGLSRGQLKYYRIDKFAEFDTYVQLEWAPLTFNGKTGYIRLIAVLYFYGGERAYLIEVLLREWVRSLYSLRADVQLSEEEWSKIQVGLGDENRDINYSDIIEVTSNEEASRKHTKDLTKKLDGVWETLDTALMFNDEDAKQELEQAIGRLDVFEPAVVVDHYGHNFVYSAGDIPRLGSKWSVQYPCSVLDLSILGGRCSALEAHESGIVYVNLEKHLKRSAQKIYGSLAKTWEQEVYLARFLDNDHKERGLSIYIVSVNFFIELLKNVGSDFIDQLSSTKNFNILLSNQDKQINNGEMDLFVPMFAFQKSDYMKNETRLAKTLLKLDLEGEGLRKFCIEIFDDEPLLWQFIQDDVSIKRVGITVIPREGKSLVRFDKRDITFHSDNTATEGFIEPSTASLKGNQIEWRRRKGQT